MLPLLFFADTPLHEMATVVVTSDEPATLEVDDGDGYRAVCRTPCREIVSTSAFVRLAGPGIAPSPGVHAIEDTTLYGTVRGTAARNGQHIGGVALMALGAVAGIAASYVAMESVSFRQGEGDRGNAALFYGLNIGGLAAIATGVLLVWTNRTASTLEPTPKTTPERSWKVVPAADRTSAGVSLEARF